MEKLIKNRRPKLGSSCTAHKEESLHISQAFRNFIEQLVSLHSWLSEVIGGFLRTHIDMRMRRKEIESLLRSVTSLCAMVDEAQAYKVQMKGDVLQVAGLGYGRPGLCKGVSPLEDPTDGETQNSDFSDSEFEEDQHQEESEAEQ
ncbi:hypothetical protein DAPPUDRAFT_250281 [Daphnia pulex]|uniref:Uncharacterized protein n=1 Tax=Daphnia pulex TaxID=6669 RepID=E9GY85_DAPPU|nr:hypothetical protein DAPPUDRAFT_250281 [Daphnia pulex]|eukprot:EFX75558.1 hypothetical protein DAPPUDRAFT_250281 [Daphnia pulex]